MSFRRNRSKIRCAHCGRRGKVRTLMVLASIASPGWRWRDDYVPARECGRCGDGWLDHVAAKLLDDIQTGRRKGFYPARKVILHDNGAFYAYGD